jgi:CBS domain-containing protein
MPGESIATAIALLHARRIGAVLVRDERGAVQGVLSERDVVRGLSDHGAALLDQPVASLMTREVKTCAPDDSIDHIMAVMTERRVRHLPVMDDDRLVGVISIGDVVKHRLAEIESEAQDLRAYIAAA